MGKIAASLLAASLALSLSPLMAADAPADGPLRKPIHRGPNQSKAAPTLLRSNAIQILQINNWIWGSIFVGFALFGGGIVFLVLRSRKRDRIENETKQAAEETKSVKIDARLRARLLDSSEKRTTEVKKNVKLTAQTKQAVAGIFSNVKMEEAATVEVASDMDALNTSGLIDAFAQDLVTDVKVDQTDGGKFSKMTIEASLIFDEEKKS